mgnify:CR=1 FL=1
MTDPRIYYGVQNEATMPFVYIMTNKPNGTFYLGSTTDLQNRVFQHKTSTTDSFTRKYKLTQLVWFQEFENLVDAQAQEWAMKKWKRQWKINTILELNPNWRDLSEDFNR